MGGFAVQQEADIVSYSKDSQRHGARSGVISIEHSDGGSVARLETPCFLLHTVKGCSPNVTWDGLERLHSTLGREQAWGIQADMLQLVDHKDSLIRYVQEQKNVEPYAGARRFMGYPTLSDNVVLVATPRDPCRYEYIGAVRNTIDEKASIMTGKGAMWLSPEEYMELAGLMSADIVVAMGDEVVSDCKKGRGVSSSKRTIQWMQRCLDVRNSSIGARPLLLCPIVGGSEISTREDAYTYIHSLVEHADGIYISGLGTGESPGSRLKILDFIVDKAPREKLRMVSGISNPGEVLQAIARGIDVFDTSFIDTATRSGYALHFPVDAQGDTDIDMQQASSAGMDATKINLWSEVYVRDKSPLVPQCLCDTCRNHTRAYIHHLLITHEMTGSVLLEQHNIFHMVSFFRAIRTSIGRGTFQDYMTRWIERQHQWQRG